MKVTIPNNFLQTYEDKKGQWKNDKERKKFENLKEHYDDAIEIRQEVLQHASRMQEVDDNEEFDVLFKKTGEVQVDEPTLDCNNGSFSGKMTFDDSKGKIDENSYDALEKLDTEDKKKVYSCIRRVSGTWDTPGRSWKESDIEYSTRSFERRDSKDGIIFGIGKKQAGETFKREDIEIECSSRNFFARKEKETQTAIFNQDGTITLINGRSKVHTRDI
jgi:hypothetical protein